MNFLVNIISISLTDKQAVWLSERGNKSEAIQGLIDKEIMEANNPEMLLTLIKTEEELITSSKEKLNFYFNKLSTIIKNKEEIENAEKERMQNLIKKREETKTEMHRKIEASPYFKEIVSMKVYDESKALKIIEKCRNAGNREFGTYDLKEYLENRK